MVKNDPTQPPPYPPRRDLRVLQARLAIISDSLSATIIFNPLTTALCALVLWPAWSPFGAVAHSRLVTGFALQLGCAAVAFVIHRSLRVVPFHHVRQTEAVLLLTQIAFGIAWGMQAFLYWVPADPVNHVFVAMLMAVVGYSMVFTRSMHLPVVIGGVLAQNTLVVARFALSTGTDVRFLTVMALAYIGYLLMMAAAYHKRIDAMIAARFSNEDLTAALKASRDEALVKRHEAETANASKTAFLANMSHELRTPLNAILGFSDIIAHQSMGRDQVERYSDYARDIHSSGAHLLELINDLLDVAKIEAGKMEIEPRALDPRPLVEEVSRVMYARITERKQILALEMATDTPLIMADERAFKQMLFNLLSNAVKFTPPGGRITLSCRNVAEGGLEVAVSDNGPGIAPEKLACVFEPFSQIDNRFDREAGGTGLGLALVQGLAGLHGGRVWLQSTLGEGVIATIYLPSTMMAQEARAVG